MHYELDQIRFMRHAPKEATYEIEVPGFAAWTFTESELLDFIDRLRALLPDGTGELRWLVDGDYDRWEEESPGSGRFRLVEFHDGNIPSSDTIYQDYTIGDIESIAAPVTYLPPRKV